MAKVNKKYLLKCATDEIKRSKEIDDFVQTIENYRTNTGPKNKRGHMETQGGEWESPAEFGAVSAFLIKEADLRDTSRRVSSWIYMADDVEVYIKLDQFGWAISDEYWHVKM